MLFDSGGGGGGGVALELGGSTAGGSPLVEPSIWLEPVDVDLLFSFRPPRLWKATSDIMLGDDVVGLPNEGPFVRIVFGCNQRLRTLSMPYCWSKW